MLTLASYKWLRISAVFTFILLQLQKLFFSSFNKATLLLYACLNIFMNTAKRQKKPKTQTKNPIFKCSACVAEQNSHLSHPNCISRPQRQMQEDTWHYLAQAQLYCEVWEQGCVQKFTLWQGTHRQNFCQLHSKPTFPEKNIIQNWDDGKKYLSQRQFFFISMGRMWLQLSPFLPHCSFSGNSDRFSMCLGLKW